jgi:4-amino-4-deoxy-L-arabinose transferase-like glycosyltransferase
MTSAASRPVPAGGVFARDRRTDLLAATALLVWWLFGLGAVPLTDVDEGAFSAAVREMLAGGDWLHTTLNGEDRFDKPIAVYWLQAASVLAFGPGEFAMRLPSALCAWGWCLLVAHFAGQHVGRTAGWPAAALLACALGPMLIGRAATADAALNLLICAAAFDLWRHLETGRAAPLRRAALWMGLAVLTKGPVGLLVPGAAVLVWIASSGAWSRLGPLLRDPRAWGLGLAVALPWYLYAWSRHGQAFIDGFFVRHNLERFSGPMEGHGGSLAYYLVVLPLLLLPWSLLLPAVIARSRTLWADPLARYLLGWAGFVLVFFSLSGTKLPHYALYGVTPLVLLAARVLAAQGDGAPRWAVPAVAVGAVALVLLGPASDLIAERVIAADPAFAPLLTPPLVTMGTGLWSAVAIGLIGLLALAPLALAQVAPLRPTPVLRAVGIAFIGSAHLLLATLPGWVDRLQRPVRELGIAAREAAVPLAQWNVHQPSFSVYAMREAPRRAPRPGELALTRVDVLSPSERASIEIVAERSGFLLVRLHAPAAAPTGGVAP